MLQRLSHPTLAVGIALAALTIGFATGLSPLRAAAASNRHVIVISLDGFAAYALADQSLPLPNVRRLASAGVMAEAMVGVNPTVTWPNHTTLVTGVGPDQHGVLYNGLPVRNPSSGNGAPIAIQAHVDKAKLVLTPTVYDAAHAAGLTTGEVDWVAIEHAPTITWSFSEYGDPQAPVAREMVAAGVVSEAELQQFKNAQQPFHDEIWARAAEHIITAHKPNLLLVHFLTTDGIQHQYGARSAAARAALTLVDAYVGRLVEATRKAGILADTTFVIVSDHGFKTYKNRIRPNALLQGRDLGLAAYAISEGGTAIVYMLGRDDATRLELVKQAFTGVEGIDRILTPAEYGTYGYPTPAQSDRMGQLVLVAREGYAFDNGTTGTGEVPAGASPGSHGYLNTDPDMRAIFIASGAGVRHGAVLGVIKNVDVAPTLARWLGVDLPNTVGKPLDIIE